MSAGGGRWNGKLILNNPGVMILYKAKAPTKGRGSHEKNGKIAFGQ